MIGVYEEDYSYADSRLRDTIVRWGGKAFYVLQIEGDGMIVGKYLSNLNKDGSYEKVHVSELDVSSPPLGYVNSGDYACYVVRIPRRDDWRQGLRTRSLKSLTGRTMTSIRLTTLHHTIEDTYPTFKKALKKVGSKHSVAWHRHWAVGHGVLYYRDLGVVGEIVEDKPTLYDHYDFLEGELEDAL